MFGNNSRLFFRLHLKNSGNWSFKLWDINIKTLDCFKTFSYFAFKRLSLGNTTGWQHRFSDLTILSPIWLGTYEYMKSTLNNFFFRFETGLPEWIFQIWPNILKSDPVLVYMKKSKFWAFFGLPKVSRPLGIPKEGAGSVKVQKIGFQHV